PSPQLEVAAGMKRFYTAVTVEAAEHGWRVQLDGRGIKTAGGRPQLVPTRALADAMAEEWAGQGEIIEPFAFRFRDLADYAIDVAGTDRARVIQAVLRFAE